jgi:ATP-binding cassette subfamily B protein
MSFWSDVPRVVRLLKGERANYGLGLLALWVVNFSDVMAPLFLAVAVDLMASSLGGAPPKLPAIMSYVGLTPAQFNLETAIACFFGLQLTANVARYPMLVMTSIPSHRVGQRVRNELVGRLLSLSRGFFDRSKSGDLMALQTNDIIAVRMMLGPGILVGVDTLMLVSLVIVVMFALSWKLALLALIPMPLIAIVTNKLSHAEYQRSEAVQNDIGRLTEQVRESYAGIRILQGYAREGYDRERFRLASFRHYGKSLDLGRVRSVFDPALDFFLGSSTSIVLAVGGPSVVRGEMSLGSFTAFLFLINFLSGPMVGFGWAVSLWQRGRASLKRLDKVMAEQPEVADMEGAVALDGAVAIEVRGLTFGYAERGAAEIGTEEREVAVAAPEQAAALDGVSFVLAPGKLLGVTGRVGSGKSTLAMLLTRIYEPPAGTIFVNGRDVRDYTLSSLRRSIVVAPQDTFLFSDTIENNLLMGIDAETAGGSVWRSVEAARLAGLASLAEEIEELPKRYGTLLGERGVNLSGGQRQRLAIARAIGADPRMLVLDDCLSAVDARTEARILEQLRTVFEGRSGIIISHRVRALEQCDEILVLEAGRVIERGTHAALLAQGGHYGEIAHEQTKEAVSE